MVQVLMRTGLFIPKVPCGCPAPVNRCARVFQRKQTVGMLCVCIVNASDLHVSPAALTGKPCPWSMVGTEVWGRWKFEGWLTRRWLSEHCVATGLVTLART